ncbi:hypothetical protein ABLT91_19050 [Acinetobacter pittii]|uniref:RipA family octameric membrane protein n=1 Tax=Acinetobacter pittii TaxID=48296 RepID=UPI0024DE473D|nr:hypothetical protein [Acinetobacter pittii]
MKKDESLAYLWDYFDRHSSQRLQMFNYYILVNIAVLTGVGICLKESMNLLILPSILLLFLNNIFKKIDERTVFMIKQVEKIIKNYELKNIEIPYQIFNIEENNFKNKENGAISYSKIFSEVYNVMDFTAIVFICIGVWNILV